MKKFTRLWQVMVMIVLSSSIVFAQTTVQDAQKGINEKDYLLKQKKIEQELISNEINQNPVANKLLDGNTLPSLQAQGGITSSKVLPFKVNYEGSNTDGVLYTQMTASTYGTSCQEFVDPANVPYSAEGADDFLYTSGAGTYIVTNVNFVGSWSAAGPALGFNIRIYNDDDPSGPIPGSPAYEYINVPYVESAGIFSVWLPSPVCVLDDGVTYWISIQCHMEYAVGGQWYWTTHDPATTQGLEANWQNPGDGFGTTYTTWTGLNTAYPGYFDYTFELTDDPPPTCPPPTALFTDNATGTDALANWTDMDITNLYDIVWGEVGVIDPDNNSTYTGEDFGYIPTFGGPLYSHPLDNLIPGVTYEWYVRTVCGPGDESIWVKSATFISLPPPPNDECFNAQPVGPLYPVLGIPGTTIGATVSCPGALDQLSGDVWYAIELPFSLNNIEIDIYGDALLDNGWIVGTDVMCSCDLLDYYYAVSWNFAPPDVTDMIWEDIPGPGIFYYPMATGTYQENFTLDVNVTEQLIIQNDFFITLDPLGNFADGGGTDFYPGGLNGWWYYEESTFWNIWFYDHPFSFDRYKEIHIEIDVEAFDPGIPTYLQFVVNWSTPEWSLVGNPLPDPRFPPIPPLTLPEEDLYIGRELLVLIDDFVPGPTPYVFDFVLPDYNPEWVSIDVLGENFIINGFIVHECLADPDPPPINDDCEDAIFIGGVFPQPVLGTTLGATVDCPGVLDWDAVWYEIDLPLDECYYIEIDLCLDDFGATLTNTGIILTEDCTCDPASFIYSDGLWAVAGNCINDLNFYVEGPGTVYYPVMTDPKGDFTFNINLTVLPRISGKLTYANGAMTPMWYDEVTADDLTNPILRTNTDMLGDYLFMCLNPGAYTLGGRTIKDCGGLNMADVQTVRQYVTGQPPGNTLSGLYLEAGDVDQSGTVNMNDVQFMRQNIVIQLPGFVPYWIFEHPVVNVPPSQIQDFKCICAGDVDGTYIPQTSHCPAGANLEDEFIETLSVGTINVAFTADLETYHNYYDDHSTGMTVLTGYPITVTNSVTPYTGDQCTVWVDWNQDFDFDDLDEQFILTDTSGDGSVFNGTITPPDLSPTPTGETRMRVRLNFTDVPNPCVNASWGEVHDYKVIVNY